MILEDFLMELTNIGAEVWLYILLTLGIMVFIGFIILYFLIKFTEEIR